MVFTISGGLYKSRKLVAPKGDATRPTSSRLRQAVFNIIRNEVEESSFLDLFAGSGAMGLEALSLGACRSVFIDNSKESIRCIQTNVETLKVENRAQIIYGDVFVELTKLIKRGASFDIIFADPPYALMGKDGNCIKPSLSLAVLDLVLANQNILAKGGSLLLEDSLYSGHLNPGKFDKEAAQVFVSGTSDHCHRQGASEDQKISAKPTPSKFQDSGGLSIYAQLRLKVDEDIILKSSREMGKTILHHYIKRL